MDNTLEKKVSKKDIRDKYFIKDIENITGIKAYTLRIWEQRYNLLEPKRTSTNIRYYDEDDLKYILNVSILNNHGFKISKIARMSREEVQAQSLKINENNTKYESQVKALSAAMFAFDEKEFNKILSINILKLGVEETMEGVIFPFMEHVGMLWLTGAIHVAHEHFITNLIRQRLYVVIDALNFKPMEVGNKFLLFVPQGEYHDLSLLFASYVLRARSQNVIYLGTSTPLEELNNIFKLHKPDYIFCAVTTANSSVPVQIYINSLSKNFPESQILVTGSQILKHKDLNIPANIRLIRTIKEFIDLVDNL